MTNDIKTAADRIVEKYFPHTLGITNRRHSIKCAIIEVEACVAQLNQFSLYWDIANGEWYNEQFTQLESIHTELKSRIV